MFSILHGNRIEALAEQLLADPARRDTDILRPETLIVPSLGLEAAMAASGYHLQYLLYRGLAGQPRGERWPKLPGYRGDRGAGLLVLRAPAGDVARAKSWEHRRPARPPRSSRSWRSCSGSTLRYAWRSRPRCVTGGSGWNRQGGRIVADRLLPKPPLPEGVFTAGVASPGGHALLMVRRPPETFSSPSGTVQRLCR